MEAVKAEIAAVQSQVSQLIFSESTAPANVRGMYTEQITRASERLKALELRLRALERGGHSARRREETRLMLEGVLMDLEAFWARDDRSINQALHAIFSGHKFMVRDGRIVALESFA